MTAAIGRPPPLEPAWVSVARHIAAAGAGAGDGGPVSLRGALRALILDEGLSLLGASPLERAHGWELRFASPECRAAARAMLAGVGAGAFTERDDESPHHMLGFRFYSPSPSDDAAARGAPAAIRAAAARGTTDAVLRRGLGNLMRKAAVPFTAITPLVRAEGGWWMACFHDDAGRRRGRLALEGMGASGLAADEHFWFGPALRFRLGHGAMP